MWLTMAKYGRQAPEDSPAHGGIILIATLPLAGVVSLVVFVLLAIWLYKKFLFSK
jgi:hypothetical protein